MITPPLPTDSNGYMSKHEFLQIDSYVYGNALALEGKHCYQTSTFQNTTAILARPSYKLRQEIYVIRNNQNRFEIRVVKRQREAQASFRNES